jgi:hypothetical protein
VIAHGRFSGNGRPAAWVAADVVRIEDGKLAEHWDVLQDEATQAAYSRHRSKRIRCRLRARSGNPGRCASLTANFYFD